jgi:hypothetical protein
MESEKAKPQPRELFGYWTQRRLSLVGAEIRSPLSLQILVEEHRLRLRLRLRLTVRHTVKQAVLEIAGTWRIWSAGQNNNRRDG